ncbi:MFS transporter [Streptomonospora sediminis]
MSGAPLTTESKGYAIKLGRDFPRFWAGALSSNLADGVMLTALPMVAAMLSNDPLLVSGLMVARFLPWLLVGLFAGVLVDRLDRVRIMAAANLVRGGALALLAVLVATGQATVWWLYAVMFTAMLCEVFYDLAGRAALPDVVPPGTLDRANGRLEGGRTVSEGFAGAPLAGFLFAVTAALPLAANAGAYVLGALVLLGLPLAVRRPPNAASGPAAGPDPGTDQGIDTDTGAGKGRGGALRSVFADIGAGAREVFGRRRFRAVVLFTALVNIALMAQAGVLVLLVRDHFGVPEALYGVFMSSAAAGGLLGAATVSRIVRLLGRFGTAVLAYGLMGALSAAFALAPNAATAAVAWCAVAFTAAVANIVASGVWQLVVPGPMLGRALSCIQTVASGVSPLGAVAGGFLGRVDLRLPSVAAAAAIVLGVAVTAPALRALARSADEAERNSADPDSPATAEPPPEPGGPAAEAQAPEPRQTAD